MTIARTLRISALFAMLASPALAADTSPHAEQAVAQRHGAAAQERTKPEQLEHERSKPEAAADARARTALPTLPLFELPEQASDSARQHVGLAHARRDSRRAEHTRAAAQGAPAAPAARAAHHKPAQKQLAAARQRLAAAQDRRIAASEQRAEAQERRAAAQERRAAALQHREAAAEQRLKAAELQAAAQEHRASAGRK